MGGAKRVEQDNDLLARDTRAFVTVTAVVKSHSFGIGCSIQPGVTVPANVRVAVMTDSSYLVAGHPQDELAAPMAVDDPHPMWKVLTIAFGSEDTPVHGENSTLGIARDRP